MNTSFTSTNPDQIEFTLQVSMPLWQWKKLRDQLGQTTGEPSISLFFKIGNMIAQAEKEFTPESE